MKAYRALKVLPLAVLLLPAACGRTDAQDQMADFTILTRSAEGFSQARRGRALHFPADHGPHPDFRFEWWYLSANLEDSEGQSYGAQWTLFRLATEPAGSAEPENPWQSRQVYMAHLAITTPAGHEAYQRYARSGDHGGIAQAGVSSEPFVAWLDDWTLKSLESGWLPLELKARQGNTRLTLRLDSDRTLMLQGDEGFSQKHPLGGGSHYYSHPWLEASGELRTDNAVISLTGQAWLDREWSSQFLQPDQLGWDWFALHLESGEKLMLFRLRQRPGTQREPDYRHGVLIAQDGSKRILDPKRIRVSPTQLTTVAGRRLPLHWQVDLPEAGRSLEIEPLHPEQWLEVDFPYWEGVVEVSGAGPGNRGRGYMELTGYGVQ